MNIKDKIITLSTCTGNEQPVMLSREKNVWIHLMSGSRIMKSSYLNQKKIVLL